MSKIWPGSLITKTPVTPAGPYTNGAAPGLWTLSEQAYWQKEGFWPITYSSWIATLGGTSADHGYAIAVDSSDSIYVGGDTQSAGAGSNDVLIAKYDVFGSIQWQRTLGGASLDVVNAVTVDSSDNIYVGGQTQSTGAGNWDFLIVKYDSSGTVQWQRTLGGTLADIPYGIIADSSGNIYVAGYTLSSTAGSRDFLVAKYNSSGTIQWQRRLGNTGSENANGITVDSSNNIYVIGYTASTGAGGYDFLLVKYNSSGTIQWQRTLGGIGDDYGFGAVTDSSGNIYVVGQTDSAGAGGTDVLIAKYDSSGTIQWQRTLGGASSDYGRAITIDSSDNIYVTGYTQSAGAGGTDVLIAKYDSSGTIQWQRTLGGTSSDYGLGITVDSSDNIYVAGYTASTGAGSWDILIAKFLSDGSLTGTYGPWTYAVSSLTDATSALTSATSSLGSATTSLTSSTSTLTAATSSLTATFTPV